MCTNSVKWCQGILGGSGALQVHPSRVSEPRDAPFSRRSLHSSTRMNNGLSTLSRPKDRDQGARRNHNTRVSIELE